MHRKKIIVSLFLSIVVLSSCTTPIASEIATPIPTSTLFPTLTPTPTYIPITPVLSGTQAPESGAVISTNNVDRLTLLARWGEGNISQSLYTPDGKYLIAGSSIGIYFYDSQDYSLVKSIDLKTPIYHLAITNDGQKIAATSLEKIFLFDIENNEPLLTIEIKASPLAFSPDGQILALGIYDASFNNHIELWNTTTGEVIRKFEESDDFIRSIVFSPNGNFLATGGYTTKIWSLDGKLVDSHYIGMSGGSTYSLSFSPDGTLLAEGADAGNLLHLWKVLDNGTLGVLRSIVLKDYPIVFEVEISPDGKWLAAATSRGLFVWNMDTGRLIYEINDNYTAYRRVSWSPDSKTFVSNSDYNGVEIRNKEDGKLIKPLSDFSGGNMILALSPDGEVIVSSNSNGRIFFIGGQNGKVIRTFEGDSIGNGFAISPNGLWLAIESNPFTGVGGVEIFNLTDDNFYHVLEGSNGSGLTQGSFSRDGKYLVTSGFDVGQKIIQVWNTKDWSLHSAWKMDDELINTLIFCPDGQTVALLESRASSIKFYRISDGNLVQFIQTSPQAISFSPNGQMLLSIDEDSSLTKLNSKYTLSVWQVDNGSLVYGITHPPDLKTIPLPPPYYRNMASSIAWSFNGDLYAIGFPDGMIGIFRANDGKLLQTLSGHTMRVLGVAFSPDGRILVSASLDGTIRLWGIK